MYRLIWLIEAYDELDNQVILLSEEQAARLIPLVRRMETLLTTNPHEYGESREQGYRIAFFDYLLTRYRIEESTRTVYLASVRIVRPLSNP